ncbi:Alpha-1,3-mannosyltransferase alg2 [Taphrina deformans PYCC 5710]|uniref:Alpha-1,3/1,6-mannosyltransferase ALG2 n=1 Tax=Taphrina deformans (strain PYCC 5710 / ATCC 11124 / CBS 356.35 / IMI 108563 / JCM 9778 / NBRC 8474) TaxID=1097556 RepID=R4XCP6_TAPDE|nr:Alpha-1,3-mannosyltransferase alg2 [Taphrina deformans PYCC 5710]|eukprot:CCG82156.1 Alpha-1,3-mannosyltransferase alg2 [Taphrina deformans PYCC 5710]
MKIAFLHPDLGIGGAERLVIDAAVGLQKLDHDVVIYTSFRDKKHCFDEARDGTLEVRVRGDTIFPPNIGGRFSILCAMLRQIHLAITLIRDTDHYDAIFIDQLSIAIPLLKFFLQATPILFYCHFPDKLLSQRTNIIKELYRVPFDLLEGWTTGQADTIVVNSQFTASIFKKAFPRIQIIPKVVYPCVDVQQSFSKANVRTDRQIVLSINRFERKKNIELALQSFSALKTHARFADIVLVLAGGYDERVSENVNYHSELQTGCSQHGLNHQTLKGPYNLPLRFENDVNVYFLLSIPAELKASLLACSTLLAYTPENEHFGIVPIEASLAGLPVLAQDNGGPLESVEDGITGFSRPPDAKQWTTVMAAMLFNATNEERNGLGQAGRKKVLDTFSQETMARSLEDEFQALSTRPKDAANIYAMAVLAIFVFSLWRWALRPLVILGWDKIMSG